MLVLKLELLPRKLSRHRLVVTNNIARLGRMCHHLVRFLQVLTLALFAVKLGRQRGTLDEEKAGELLSAMRALPDQIAYVGFAVLPTMRPVCSRRPMICVWSYSKVLEAVMEPVKMAARVFRYANNFLYLGRGYNFPVALEGALKLKEISYIHAEGYPVRKLS